MTSAFISPRRPTALSLSFGDVRLGWDTPHTHHGPTRGGGWLQGAVEVFTVASE